MPHSSAAQVDRKSRQSETTNGEYTISFREWGHRGDPTVVVVHGLLFTGGMFERVAARLVGCHVVAVDVRGHGTSSRPKSATEYSWASLASDVVAVLNALAIDRAVIGGLSLGANVALEFAHRYPGRLSGLIVEMPVLSESEGFARVVFGTLSTAFRLSSPVLGAPTALVRKLPSPTFSPELAIAKDLLSPDPLAAAALIEGLQASPIPRHDVAALSEIAVPALVIGHRLDPIHHYDDAVALAAAIPNAELVSVRTILDFRLRPDCYAAAISEFLIRHSILGLVQDPDGL